MTEDNTNALAGLSVTRQVHTINVHFHQTGWQEHDEEPTDEERSNVADGITELLADAGIGNADVTIVF